MAPELVPAPLAVEPDDDVDEAAEPPPELDMPDVAAAAEPEPADPADVVADDELAAPPAPLPSARAWFVEPDVLLYFTVSAPDGEVAPWRTAVLLVSRVSAIDSGVCTSPRTSSEVSRFDEYAMPPGERALLA